MTAAEAVLHIEGLSAWVSTNWCSSEAERDELAEQTAAAIETLRRA